MLFPRTEVIPLYFSKTLVFAGLVGSSDNPRASFISSDFGRSETQDFPIDLFSDVRSDFSHLPVGSLVDVTFFLSPFENVSRVIVSSFSSPYEEVCS